MPEYRIPVIINPMEQPPSTAPDGNVNPTGAETGYDASVSARGAAGLVLAVGALKRTGEGLVGSIGTLTGNSKLQRSVQTGLKASRWAFQISTGPVGIVAVGTEVLVSEVSRGIEVAQKNRDAQYQASLRGNVYNGGR